MGEKAEKQTAMKFLPQMKQKYLATFFFFKKKDPCKMPGFSLPLKVAVQFVRHVAVSIQNLLSHVLGTYLQVHIQHKKCISSQTLLSFLVLPYAAISMMQLTNNCVTCKAGETTAKINDRKIFWLYEFSS